MDLSLSDTEQQLAASVRDFVSRAAPKDTLVDLQSRNAESPDSWAPTMAAAGWLGLLVPEAAGGSGATAMEASQFFAELGRGPLPPAWLASSGVVAPILAAAPASDTRDEALRGLAAGTSVLVPAFQAAGSRWSGISSVGTGPELTVQLDFVGGLTDATDLLVPVTVDGESGFALLPRRHPRVASRRLGGFLADSSVVTVDHVDLGPVPFVPCPFDSAEIDHSLALGAAMVSSYQVGSCERLLEISVAHASERVQFGQLIGAFQRVQDHVVRIVNALDSARWLLYDALATDASGDRFVSKAWLARAAAVDAHWECANAAHEVLAGIGSDPAHGTVLHTAMSRLLHDLLGDPAYCRRRHAVAEGWVTAAGPA